MRYLHERRSHHLPINCRVEGTAEKNDSFLASHTVTRLLLMNVWGMSTGTIFAGGYFQSKLKKMHSGGADRMINVRAEADFI